MEVAWMCEKHGFLCWCVGRWDLWNGLVTSVLPSWMDQLHHSRINQWIYSCYRGGPVMKSCSSWCICSVFLYADLCHVMMCQEGCSDAGVMLLILPVCSVMSKHPVFINCLVSSLVLKQCKTDWGTENRMPGPRLPTVNSIAHRRTESSALLLSHFCFSLEGE